MQELIVRCAQLHMTHIAGGDSFETGSSRPLDFGHWSAHKLEQISRFKWTHGEAVAIGIALDATISWLNKMISQKEWERILTVLFDIGFQIYTPELRSAGKKGSLLLMDGLNEFREHLGGRLTIMLLERLGKGKEMHEIKNEWVSEAIDILEQKQKERQKSLPVHHSEQFKI
jgi:3-dehydroquinate synthase